MVGVVTHRRVRRVVRHPLQDGFEWILHERCQHDERLKVVTYGALNATLVLHRAAVQQTRLVEQHRSCVEDTSVDPASLFSLSRN